MGATRHNFVGAVGECRRPGSRLLAAMLRCLLVAPGVLAYEPALAADRPNVVVILADDFGYGSVGCYGLVGLETPNLDRLANEGRRFTQAYAPGSVCSPTRYALLTGRYYWRTSVKDGEVLAGNAPLHIETDRLTLSSVCKSRGYRTAAFGKWHLGMTADKVVDWSAKLTPGPREIGFDHFFGMASNPWSGPHSFIENDLVLGTVPGEPILVSERRENARTSGIERQWDEHQITRTLTEQALAWMGENHSEPFLVYFAHTAVHRPIAPNPRFTGSKYGPYGDFIAELDWSVGQVLDALDRHDLAKNTLVVFTSDNGGVAVEGLQDEVGAAHRAGLKVNGKLRGGKHDIWEGGFRVPFLARWPDHVPAGTVSDDIVCLTDLVATVAGILEVPLPAGHAEDSLDVRPALLGATANGPFRQSVILQDAHASYAIRSGDWKLVERTATPDVLPRNRRAANRRSAATPKRDELFRLSTDETESIDVSSSHPDVVERLRKELIQARDRGFTRPGAGT